MPVENQYEQYARFVSNKNQLAKIIEEASVLLSKLDMQQQCKNLSVLSEKVRNENFKVQIVGTFKNGKSTFINSLLGEEVLPAYALPCTAIVNEVKWAGEKKAIVHFRNPLPEKLQSGIPEKTMLHMQKHGMKNIPPITIPYDEVEQYAVISIDHGKEEIEYESPYEKVEIFWPLPILKNGVEIIDSPGLNECATRTRVTMDYISKADAILFVLDATRILSADEMRVIQHTLRDQGFDDPFVIVNKFDAIREREKEPMKAFVKDKLKEYTTNEFFFVSALDALDGKLDGDAELLEGSGMPLFEKGLSEYLTVKKGKAKLSQPTNELKRILSEEAIGKTIPLLRSALDSSIDGLRKNYEDTKPYLEALRVKKEQIHTGYIVRIDMAKDEFLRAVRLYFNELKKSIPGWTEEYEPKKNIGVLSKKQAVDMMVKELTEEIALKIESAQIKWRKTVLEPLISDKMIEIFDDSGSDLGAFFNEIDVINSEASGKFSVSKESPLKRAMSVSGSINIDSVALNMSSKNFGNKLGARIGGAVALIGFAIASNVVGLIAAGIGVFILDKLGIDSGMVKKIKDAVSSEIVKQIDEKSESSVNDIVDEIGSVFYGIAYNISEAMNTEIDETESRLLNIIAEMEKGHENIVRKKYEISECERLIIDMLYKSDKLASLI